MSSKSLHALLLEAADRLRDTIEADIKDRANAGSDFAVTSRLISEYLKVYTMLEECYDQTIQTQRRLNIRDMLIKTITRLLELYWNMTRPSVLQEGQKQKSWSELAVNIMGQGQMIDLDIPIPRIVKDDTGPAYAHREELFMKDFRQFEEARIASEIAKPPPMPLEEAVMIVQRLERARQARHETLIKRGIQLQQATLIQPKRIQKDEGERERCANVIKNFWKKFGSRNKERKRRIAEQELIGMKPVPISPETAEKVERSMKRRKEEERKRFEELEAAKVTTRAWLEDNRQVDLERKLNELNAQFYNETKLNTGKAPVIKPRTNVLLTLMERAGDDAPDKELALYVAEQAAKKNKKKDEPKKPPPKASTSKKDKEIPIPQNVLNLKQSLEEFNELWNQEGQVASDEFDVMLVRKEMWTAMLPEIALKCETNLKTELKNLKILEMRRVRKAKPPKQRKKRQRKRRDPLGGKSDEELIAQLVGLGIACNNPTTTFKDFVGQYDFTTPVNFTSPDNENNAPSYAAVRSQMIMESVLPFACDREHMQDLPKGVLITGNKGTGKTTLALAAINALGATFLNFSPSVLVGKETPSPRILVLMLMKAARILAPSVILVDDIDRMFGKGKKKSDASKKFKKQLRKQLRKVKPRDRILLIATTSQNPLPRLCTSLFNRCIDIPKPNFPTRVLVWNFWLAKRGLQLPTISVNALSFASDGYTAASIARACNHAYRVKISRTEPNDPIEDEEVLGFLADAPEEESKPQIPFNYNGFAPKPVIAKKS